MIQDPREWSCFDDDPRNSGWGYQSPNPYDDYPDPPLEETDEGIPDENDEDETE